MMSIKKVQFQNSRAETLTGILDLPPDGQPVAYAILAHCFTCSKNLNAVKNIAGALTQKQIGVLRFDFTGLGESEGEFSDTNFSTNVSDLIDGYNFMTDHYDAPQILVGHSLGGTAVLMAASKLNQVKMIATIGSPADPEHVTRLFKHQLDELEHEDNIEVSIGGRPFHISRQFVNDLKQQSLKEILPEIDKALLFLHSPQDGIVGIENAARLFEYSRHPKSFISLDGADHLLSNTDDAIYTGETIAALAKRYINEKHYDEQPGGRVETKTGNSFTTVIRAGNHTLTSDEPKRVGGNGLGPNPYDYLLAALGSCTGITLRMYANRKKWKVDEIKVTLNHKKIHADDCENCLTESGKIDRIERQILIEGDLNDEQRSRMIEIADKCPVHRTLHSEISIKTQAKPPN